MSFKILVINPGSTSTKIGVYEDENLLFDKTLRHSAEDIAQFNSIPAQKDWRRDLVMKALREQGFDARTLSAVSGRGGLLRPIRGGTYAVNDNLVNDCTIGVQGQHASNLGASSPARSAIPWVSPPTSLTPWSSMRWLMWRAMPVIPCSSVSAFSTP